MANRTRPVLLSAKPLATAPGWRAFEVTPDPATLRARRRDRDLRGRPRRLFRVAGDEHHPESLPGQLAGGDLPDPAGRAGDDGYPLHHRRRARSISRFASRSAMASRLS